MVDNRRKISIETDIDVYNEATTSSTAMSEFMFEVLDKPAQYRIEIVDNNGIRIRSKKIGANRVKKILEILGDE